MSIDGFLTDWRSGRPKLLVASCVLKFGINVLSVFAFSLPQLSTKLGASLWILLSLAISIEVWSAVVDIRDLAAKGPMSPAQKILTILISIVLIVPAYVLGFIAATRPGS